MRKISTFFSVCLLLLALCLPGYSYAQVTFNGDNTGATISNSVGNANPLVSTAAVSFMGGDVIGTDVQIDQVATNVVHSWAADLEIVLVSPAGIRVALTTDNGDDTGTDTAVDLVFTDNSGNDVTSWDGGPPAADYRAEGGGNIFPVVNDDGPGVDLNTVFAGQSATGNWTLEIFDDAGGDAGTFNSFAITFDELEPTTVDVTFCVDLACEPLEERPGLVPMINIDGVGFSNLLDNMGGDIFCGVVNLPTGDITYNFFQAWAAGGAAEEDLSGLAGEECVNTAGTRRVFTVDEEDTVIFGWESCLEVPVCGSPSTTDITLCVDLANEPDRDGLVPQIFIDGMGFTNLTNTCDDQWCGDFSFNAGEIAYRYFQAFVGGSEFEDLSGLQGQDCVDDFGEGGTLRTYTVVQDMPETVIYAWETCDIVEDCSTGPEGANVQFCVDVSCFDPADINTVGVFGNFQEPPFDPTGNPMTDDNGDGIYCTTVFIAPGDYRYLFIQNAGMGEDEDTEDMCFSDPCAVEEGGFTNRVLVVEDGQDQELLFGWENCGPDCLLPPNLPVDFEEVGSINYGIADFAGAESGFGPDPEDPTNTVVCVEKTPGAAFFAGTIIACGGLENPIPLTATETVMTVRVLSPAAGVPVLLKIENSDNPGGIFAEVLATTTMAGWETLVFDFAQSTNQPFNPANVYDRAVIFFDFGTDGDGTVYCFDDLMLCDEPVVVTCPADVTVECDAGDLDPFQEVQMGTAMGTVEAGTLGWTDGTTGTIGNLTSSIAGIPAGATVTDVNLTIQADHTWSGDLNLRLISPDGTELQFLDNVVCPTSGNTDNADVTFDDEAGPFNCTVVSSDTGNPEDCTEDYLVAAGISGVMQPEMGSLSVFDGETAAGDWMLNIMDDVGGDGGCFYTFQVEVSYTTPPINPLVGAATAEGVCGAIEITFEDSTTQTMGDCGEFNYQIFRSFIATDVTGTADTCVQVITVEDTQAPELVCSTIEVETDDLGNIELDGDDLDGVIAGTTDNCDPGFTAEFSQLEFDCSDIDPETNQITVDVLAADCSGNDTMCTVNLDVAPALLDFDFACITEINVTLNEDCQAMLVPEMVLSGDFSCLDLFDFDIVVMDDDPTNGPIIDGCGTFQYTITEPAPDFGVEQPDPIEGFTGPFANFVLVENNGVAAGDEATATLTPTTLTLGTVSNGVCGEGPLNGLNAEASYQFGMEGMVSFDYAYVTDDGGFDAFLISFDGAMTPLNISSDASTNGSSNIQVSPGDMIMFMVSEEDDCFSTQNELTITNFLFTFPEPTAAAFNAANFETCWGFVNAEDKTSPELEEDGEIVAPTPLYCDDLARINVNELPNGVSRCWIQSGQTGQTLNGSMNPALRQRLLAGGGIPNFVDGCSDVEICVNDQVENIGACEDMTITRIFTARDGISCEAEAGEENAPTVYSYEIIFTRPTIDDVDAITPTAEFECNDVLDLLPPNQFGDENPTPEFDDFPFFDDGSGPVYLTESFCNLGATFRDGPRIVTCENTYKFVRTFTVIDWCEPETIRDFTQLVKVGDFDAPVITAPTQDLNFNGIPDQEEGLGPIFFSTSNPDCSANFIIPAGDADDNCDDDPEVIALIYPNGNTDGAAVGPFQVGGPAFGIPVGVHTLRYIARDACDNADTLDVPLEVGDRTAPVAICEDGLDISLGGAGQAQLCGEDIDQASYDECSEITRLIAFVGANNLPLNDAQTLALTGIAQGGWRECITLTCELLDDDPDSPDFVAVGLLVTDASQNSNSCWLDVLVEDKLPPLCVAPGPVTTTCDDEDILSLPQDLNQAAQDDPTTTFAQLDQIFGSANGLDNCPDFDITQMVVDTRNSCGVGQILRSFFVTDGEGFNSTNPCSQTITVLGIHDYTIRFPEDFGSEACVEPDYDGVTFEERGCDLITTTTRIDTFEATADECYKLRITYEVLNWCEYSTEADPYEVPRDADNDDFLEEPTWVHVLPRDESTLSDDIAYLDSDANRFNGFISPLDLHDPNGQVFGASTQPYGTDESRGAFLYRQFIKVYDDVAPEVTDVTGDLVFEDEDGNCAEPVVLTIEVDDECTTEEDYTATAQLDPFFEDIDLDGILTLADFVPTADPSLQPNVVNNNDGTFTVSFNVELPLGRHAVRLRATDGCGNAETILIIFEVIDDKAPTPVCINGLTATLMPDGNGGGMAAIWANEYVVSGGEDCTGPVKFAIYHPDDFEALDNGTLIPNVIDTGIVLDCDDEGMLIVRVYAIDGNGNADYCETTLSVQAFQPNTCEGGDDGGNIFGLIESPAGTATPNVEVSISDDGSMSQMNVTDQSGEYSFTELALGEDYTIEPTLEAEVNVATAVTTFDILLINRHILAIAELESPYQHVVADVNMDGQINVLDVVHIRMVIMGQRTDYPQGPTWRFADRDYAFSANPGNWASEAFAELHNINDLPGDILGADFYALEMGNVSEGVIAENGLLPEDGEARSRAVLTTESLQLTAGNSYELPFRAADLYGFQGTLELAAGLELMDITYGALHAQHVNLEAAAEGLIALSYDEVAGTTTEELFRLRVRATRDGALSELLSLTDRMTRAEGYPLSGGVADLNLDFTTAPLAADEFSLGQNAPNPVDRATQIAFTLPRAATATLTVRDVQGRTLLVREIEAGAGTNLLTLRREELGAAGVLSYTLTAGEFTATKQMVIR